LTNLHVIVIVINFIYM